MKTKKKTVTYRCQVCADPCNHTWEFRVFKTKDGYFTGSGPYETKEEADRVIDDSIKALEARDKQNTA